mgnify:FL=1
MVEEIARAPRVFTRNFYSDIFLENPTSSKAQQQPPTVMQYARMRLPKRPREPPRRIDGGREVTLNPFWECDVAKRLTWHGS